MTTPPKLSVKEENVDDLDDVLDDFVPKTPPPTQGSPATPTSPSPLPASSGRPRTNTRVDQRPRPTPGGVALGSTAKEDEATKAFTLELERELEKEMEHLVKDFTAQMDKDNGADPKPDDEASKMLKAAWEAMLVEGMDGLSAPNDSSKLDPGSQTASSNDFQAKIKQTMEKLKKNDAEAAPGSSSTEDDDIRKLIENALSGIGTGDEGDEAELTGFLETMMGQLMSKDVLYEPLKDLEEKFPSYLANPTRLLSPEDKDRHEKQVACIKKILTIFEKPDYDDKNEDSSKAIVDLMSEMQTYGTPPPEVVGEMPLGLQPGSPGMPEGCIIA